MALLKYMVILRRCTAPLILWICICSYTTDVLLTRRLLQNLGRIDKYPCHKKDLACHLRLDEHHYHFERCSIYYAKQS